MVIYYTREFLVEGIYITKREKGSHGKFSTLNSLDYIMVFFSTFTSLDFIRVSKSNLSDSTTYVRSHVPRTDTVGL